MTAVKQQGRNAGHERVPRVGVVGLAYPGYHLGEELCGAKLREMLSTLRSPAIEVVTPSALILDEAGAAKAGAELAARRVDCVLAVLTTFVPDGYLVKLLEQCDVPVFLWAVEREMRCISLVGGPLITATLFNLGKRYQLAGADIGDAGTRQALLTFARAAWLRRVLREARIGYAGGRCPIMLSMSVDEDALRRAFGTTIVALPMEEFYEQAARIRPAAASACWGGIRACVGGVTAKRDDGLRAARYYLAARRLAEEHGLHALSLNCFPQLKSQVCLAVARLNDDGIAAACEGDLHSTILMHLFQRLTGRPAFNGDWLRLYPAARAVLFSHCGAGAFGLARSPRQVRLRCSIETKDGLAVCYATHLRGPVTLANLMHGPDGLRLAVMQGQGVATDLRYEGTPLRVRFPDDPRAMLQTMSRCGAGHHWNGGAGDWREELRLLAEWSGMAHTAVGSDRPRGAGGRRREV